MMKFLLFSVFMLATVPAWAAAQAGMWLLSFVVLVYLYHSSDYFMLGYGLGVDSIAMLLTSLTVWIMTLIVMASVKISMLKGNGGAFLLAILSLTISLILSFSFMDFMGFYISFEASLIPTLILIVGWGYQPERIQAGVYMLFYTLFGSLPLLLVLFFIYSEQGGLFMPQVGALGGGYLALMASVGLVAAFLVKLPMFMFHLWLPKAHVEAPVSGSMILAGVLLKLGGYGLIRVGGVLGTGMKETLGYWAGLSLAGAVGVGFICLTQVDMKSLIAYSSVVHMALVLVGALVDTKWGVSGSVVIMVGHGLCSSGLFCVANMVYERTASRSLLINKGMLALLPGLALWWFLLSSSNMSSPPSLNLMGEISAAIGLLSWAGLTGLALGMVLFLSGAYSLYLYSSGQHGKFSGATLSFGQGQVREYLVLLLHWVPLNALILKGDMLMLS